MADPIDPGAGAVKKEDTNVHLRTVRRQRKAAITRHLGKLSRLRTENDTDGVVEQLEKLKTSFDKFEQSHDDYHSKIDPDDEEKINDSELFFEQVETVYVKKVKAVRSWLDDSTSVSVVDVPDDKPAHVEGASASDIKELVNLLSIPNQQIDVFDGNPLEYNSFITIFDEIIESKVKDDSVRLSRLLQFTKGPAKSAIKNCSLIGGTEGYNKAKKILHDRFGNKHLVSRKIIADLKNGKPVKQPDEIQQLSDDLSTAHATLENLDCTQEIDNQQAIKDILSRCPVYIQQKWRSKAVKYKRDHDSYPEFKDLVDFIEEKALECSDPVYGNEHFKVQAPKSSTPVLHTISGSAAKPNSSNMSCVLCKQNHKLSSCEKFLKMDAKARNNVIKSNRLCFNCFRSNHMVNDCKDPIRCSTCKRKHSSLIHYERTELKDASVGTTSINDPSENVTSHNTNTFGSQVFLPIVEVLVNDVPALALLDTGSTNTFMTSDLANKLQLDGVSHSYTMNTMSGSVETVSKSVDAVFASTDGSFSKNVSNILLIDKIPASYPPLSVDLDRYPHLQGIPLLKYTGDRSVDILIGMDNPDILSPRDMRLSDTCPRDLYATRCALGWSICGTSGMGIQDNIYSHSIGIEKLNEQVHELWDFENHDMETMGLSVEDQRVLKLWDATCTQEDSHYVLPIPWRDSVPNLPNNRYASEGRLNSLMKRLNRIGLEAKYSEVLDDMIDQGYLEHVPADELTLNDGSVWYVPHHPVISPTRPGKVRPVFDFSAKCKGISVNTECLQGPNMLNNLLHVLLRFRQYPLAISADIQSMYLQVRASHSDRNALRLLYYRDDKLIELRSTCHTFGAVWSSSAAAYALRRTAYDNECSELVRDVILKAFYVDDMLKSVKNHDEAKEVILGTKSTLQKGGFNLTKFTVNDNDLLDHIDHADRAQSICEILPDTISRALGIQWLVGTDEFTYMYKLGTSDGNLTRRAMLSKVSSLYDPLGLISPVIITGKMLFQEATRLKLSWDENVPVSLSDRWDLWQNALLSLPELKFNRCVVPQGFEDGVCELHTFCDASKSAYGAVSYLRIINQKGQIHVCLLASKCRLTPLKSISIPRLELCSAVVATELAQMIERELDIPITASYHWTDSKIVLSYIHNESRRFKVFVANRVSQIHSGSDPQDWRHIDGLTNPADILSRGSTPDHLPQSWFTGPDFLSDYKCNWPSLVHINHEILAEDVEIIKDKIVTTQNVSGSVTHPLDALADHYSSFYRMQKAVCWLLRLKSKLRRKTLMKGPITSGEMYYAENVIVRHVQSVAYNNELKRLKSGVNVSSSSPISKLSPKLEDGIIVVGGRLKHAPIPSRAKNPIILPNKHRVSYLIAYDYHSGAHLGIEWVLSRLRMRYWIIKARPLIKKIKYSCITCKRLYSSPMQQRMSDLPPDRCQAYTHPFSIVGLDVFGNFYVKQGRATVKRYGCIFSCYSTRAVHIEKLNDLSSSSLISALMRFSSRRGPVTQVYSDNGTNMVGAKNELAQNWRQLNQNDVIRAARVEGITWTFNPPLGSNFGGLYERNIRTIRRVMCAICNVNDRLTDETLATVFCQCENIVNSRPMSHCSDDASDMDPITPNHILLLQGNYAFPWARCEGNIFQKHWKHAEFISNTFWKQWLKAYILELHKRQKWLQINPSLAVNDIVLVMDQNTVRGQWPLGRVIEVNTGRDGLVRSAKLRTKSGTIVRPITKLVQLESKHYE